MEMTRKARIGQNQFNELCPDIETRETTAWIIKAKINNGLFPFDWSWCFRGQVFFSRIDEDFNSRAWYFCGWGPFCYTFLANKSFKSCSRTWCFTVYSVFDSLNQSFLLLSAMCFFLVWFGPYYNNLFIYLLCQNCLFSHSIITAIRCYVIMVADCTKF